MKQHPRQAIDFAMVLLLSGAATQLPGELICSWQASQSIPIEEDFMGKGDRRTRRGKVNNGSYGKSRSHKAPQSTNAKTQNKAKQGAAKKEKVA